MQRWPRPFQKVLEVAMELGFFLTPALKKETTITEKN